MSRFVRHAVPTAHVVGYGELPDGRDVRIVASVGSSLALAESET